MKPLARPSALALVFLLAIVTVTRGQAQIQTGTLDVSDGKLDSGEFVEEFEVQAPAGQTLVVTLVSLDFDPFLIVAPPQGDPVENDDFQGSKDMAQVVVAEAQAGAYTVRVTSYEPGESGGFALLWRAVPVDQAARTQEKQAEGTLNLAAMARDDSMPATETTHMFEGRLEEGDKQLPSSEWFDLYLVDARIGEKLTFDLDSDDFDTYLAVASPSGQVSENDDDGRTTNALVDVDVAENGRWFAIVTSTAPMLQGAYRLTITRGS
ncbi:MAG: hypothetical protein ABR527_00985 [Gemmatimonadota bacterium]